jgi:hypothetical protein
MRRCDTVARMSDWMDDGHDAGTGLDHDFAGDPADAGHDFTSDPDHGYGFDGAQDHDPGSLDGGSSANADETTGPSTDSGNPSIAADAGDPSVAADTGDPTAAADSGDPTITHTGDSTTEVTPHADGSNTVTFDADSDGTPDGVGYDEDGDGKFERVDLDTDHDGHLDTTYLDVDHDGKIDAILQAPPDLDVNPYLRA